RRQWAVRVGCAARIEKDDSEPCTRQVGVLRMQDDRILLGADEAARTQVHRRRHGHQVDLDRQREDRHTDREPRGQVEVRWRPGGLEGRDGGLPGDGRAWIKPIMAQYPELYTAYEWHSVDETSGRAMVYMQNRRDHPSGTEPIDFPDVTILQYTGKTV